MPKIIIDIDPNNPDYEYLVNTSYYVCELLIEFNKPIVLNNHE